MKQSSIYLSAIPFLSFLVGYFIADSWFSGPIVRAPILIGTPLVDAVIQASAMSLFVRVLDQKEDSLLPAGTIIQQIPDPGSTLKKNQVLYLVISKEPPIFYMPDYRGLLYAHIQKELETLLIPYNTFYQPSIQAYDICIGQYPEPNTKLTGPVVLYIAEKKEKPVLMPSCVGKPLYIVKNFFDQWNIDCSVTTHDVDCNDYVVDQRPLPGTILYMSKLRQVQLSCCNTLKNSTT